MSPDWLGSCQFTNQANEWVKDKRMQWVCVVITNTQWFEDCKEQVSGFLPLRRKVLGVVMAIFEIWWEMVLVELWGMRITLLC